MCACPMQLMRAEAEADAATRRAEEAEAALQQHVEGPSVADSVRVELQAALARIDTLSKALAEQAAIAQQNAERAFVLEEDVRVRAAQAAHAVPCLLLLSS